MTPATRTDAMDAYLDARSRLGSGHPETVRARNVVVEANLGLAAFHAGKYARDGAHVQREDLTQSAVLGMIRALETYDPAQAAFATYASTWIRSFIGQALEREPEIRIPVGVVERGARVRRHEAKRAARGLPLDDTDTARALEITPAQLERVRGARTIRTSSLDADIEVEAGDVGNLHDLVADGSELPDEAFDREERAQLARELLDGLTEREREIVGRHGRGETLDQAGARVALCGERVRQIESKALAKLRVRLRERGLEELGQP